MKAVHVFRGQDRGINDFLADGVGQRRLDEDAMHARIRIEPRQQGEEIWFPGGCRQDVGFGKEAKFGTGFFLAPDVDFGCRVFTHANEGQARLYPARFEGREAGRKFALDLRRDEPPVNEVRPRYHLITWMRWMVRTGVLCQRSSKPSWPLTMTWRL